MNKFDSIRPYNDGEVSSVLKSLCEDNDFLKTVALMQQFKHLQYLPFSKKILSLLLKNKIKGINSIKGYQSFFEQIVTYVIDNTIDDFHIEGLKNLSNNKSYLFISNHRDITLDSALLNYVLHTNNLRTTFNAVGNNLLSEKWASDLLRLNKSFIIDRSDKSKRDIYKSLNLASEFIFNTIVNNNESIWIAQKQGRSKDGIDFTDPSVLKMIHLNGRKKQPLSIYLNNLNVVPISISYEKDPNDIVKARELYLTDLNSFYKKEDGEDLNNIAEGIKGQKGNVSLSIGEVMYFENDSYENAAQLITEKIRDQYLCHSTNYAANIIKGKNIQSNKFNEDDIDQAITFLKKRLDLIPEELHSYLIDQYSNPAL